VPSDAPTSNAPTIDFRHLLEVERGQLQAELAELGFADGGGGGLDYDPNFADSSQVTAERGEAEVLAVQLRESLLEVGEAIARLEAGNYGNCEECGEAIQPARLEAMPATRFCIKHAKRP
jgi:RNA polymerase-binding transcription factor DksA